MEQGLNFLDFLHNKGYTGVAEQSLSTCRFTNRYLIGVIDYHLSQGMGDAKNYSNSQCLQQS